MSKHRGDYPKFVDLIELAECVKINLANMVKMMPALKSHPLLPVGEEQIKSLIEALEDY